LKKRVIDNSESVVKFQKARIQALQEELNEAMGTINSLTSEIDALRGHTVAATEDSRKHSQQIELLNKNFEKMKKQYQDSQLKNQQLEKTIVDLNKELTQLRNTQKKSDKDVTSREAKINKLIEEVERYKDQIKSLRSTEGEANDRSRKEMDRIQQDNKKLERQKNELLTAFRKQLKLIDILKRQKAHLESARLLSFTEEEFMKTLELGDKL
jgi:chromosome segregation ATPase